MKNKISLKKMAYEPDADVLSLEISNQPIDYAKEAGNVVVHFAKNNAPVLVEILEASKFFTSAKALIGARSKPAEKTAAISK